MQYMENAHQLCVVLFSYLPFVRTSWLALIVLCMRISILGCSVFSLLEQTSQCDHSVVESCCYCLCVSYSGFLWQWADQASLKWGERAVNSSWREPFLPPASAWAPWWLSSVSRTSKGHFQFGCDLPLQPLYQCKRRVDQSNTKFHFPPSFAGILMKFSPALQNRSWRALHSQSPAPVCLRRRTSRWVLRGCKSHCL